MGMCPSQEVYSCPPIECDDVDIHRRMPAHCDMYEVHNKWRSGENLLKKRSAFDDRNNGFKEVKMIQSCVDLDTDRWDRELFQPI